MRKLIYKYLINIRIKQKFFIGYLIAAIFPMLIMVVFSYNTTKSNLIEQKYKNMQDSLLQINSNIEKKLEGYAKTSVIINSDSSLQSYLNQDYSKASIEDAYYYINKYFKNILSLNTDIVLTTIYCNNNTLPEDQYFIRYINDDILNENWYNQLKNSSGNIIYGDTYKDSSGKYVFTLGRYLNNCVDKNTNDILIITIEESQIYSLIEKNSKDSFNFIVDDLGNIISYKDKSIINQNLFDTLHINKSQLSLEGRLNVNYNNEEMLLVYSTLNNSWKMITMVPYNSFLNSAQRSASYILIIFLISICLAVFLVYIFSAILTKRINILAKQASKIQEGKFDFVIKDMGNDEVGELSKVFNDMCSKLRFLIKEVYQTELMKKQAELNLLQEQINPHFLYNTLASISSLAIRNNDKRLTEIILSLSKFYRMSLNSGKQIISIRDEIKLTQYYIEIQKVRFNNLINIIFFIDESLINYKTLKIILQPFIENSINHGLWDDEGKINIIIKIYRNHNKIVFEVIDDGMGMSNEKLSKLLNDINNITVGYGIRNVNNRIKLHFGEEFGVQIFSKLGVGTQVKILIPFEEN